MKTNAFKISLAAAGLIVALGACSSEGRNADQEGDTLMTDSASPQNTQLDGTDTMMTDTSATGTNPGGGAGTEGIGSSPDTSATPSTPAP